MKHKRPIAHVQPIAEDLLALLSPSCERISIGGSIRRKCAEVSDIEIIAVPRIERVALLESQQKNLWGTPPEEREVNFLWAQLDGLAQKTGARFEKIRWGEKYRAFMWPLTSEIGSIQVDLFTAAPDNHGLILLIRTGSAQFSKAVVKALRREGNPSQGGHVLGQDGKTISTPTEEEVLRLAGMRYYTPEERSW